VALLRARIDLLAASEEQKMLDIDLPADIRPSDRSDFSRTSVWLQPHQVITDGAGAIDVDPSEQ